MAYDERDHARAQEALEESLAIAEECNEEDVAAKALSCMGLVACRRQDYAVARTAIIATPPGTSVLAPENIAVWIPTFVHRPSLVSVREIYDAEMGAHLLAEEGRTRRELRELVSGREFSEPETERLLDSLPQYEVGLVVAPISAAQRVSLLRLLKFSVRAKKFPVFFCREFLYNSLSLRWNLVGLLASRPSKRKNSL